MIKRWLKIEPGEIYRTPRYVIVSSVTFVRALFCIGEKKSEKKSCNSEFRGRFLAGVKISANTQNKVYRSLHL